MIVLAIGTYITLVVVGVCVYIRQSSRKNRGGVVVSSTLTQTPTQTTSVPMEIESQTLPLLAPGPITQSLSEITDHQVCTYVYSYCLESEMHKTTDLHVCMHSAATLYMCIGIGEQKILGS